MTEKNNNQGKKPLDNENIVELDKNSDIPTEKSGNLSENAVKPDENNANINTNDSDIDVSGNETEQTVVFEKLDNDKKDNSTAGGTNEKPADMSEDIQQIDTGGNVLLVVDDDSLAEDAAEKNANEIVLPKKKSKKRIFLYSFLIITACIIGYMVFNYIQTKKFEELVNVDTYYEGIYVDDIHLGGLTKDEAYEKITAQQKEKEKEIQVVIVTENSEYTFDREDIEIIYDTDVILTRAYDVGRSGTLKDRYYEVLELKTNNRKFGTFRSEDVTPLKAELETIALSIEKEATEPSVIFQPDGDKDKATWFSYTNPVPGLKVDRDALWDMVLQEFQDRTYGKVNVPVYEIEPDYNIDLRNLTKEIVSFKSIQARNSNREYNIALACSMINGTVLMPGEEFSMNNTTGERTKEAGFREANTIVGGNELVPGIAGGVCQVSGTLFNAAIRADLEITERYHHSFELGYLPRGRDATVNYGTIDLKFVNNRDTPIYIAMYTKGLEVYADIYGAPLEDCAYIDLWVKTVDTTPIGEAVVVKDTTVPQGSEPKVLAGHQGIVCEAYRIYRDEDGKQIASELMYTDVYKYYPPEIHIHPNDYEAYVNPTPKPTVAPAPTPKPPESNRNRAYNE